MGETLDRAIGLADETRFARSHAEVATELGMSVATVRKLEARGLAKLRRVLRKRPDLAKALRGWLQDCDARDDECSFRGSRRRVFR